MLDEHEATDPQSVPSRSAPRSKFMSLADLRVVGLVPAAGRGQRLAPLPCSKELYPIGFRRDKESGELRAEVASHHLFEKFRSAGIKRAYVIVRQGKWDIPAYFGDGQVVGINVAYLVITDSLGPPDTLDRAYAFVHDQSVAFGFPDIRFGPADVFERLLNHLSTTMSDIVLGLYRAVDVRSMDMIEVAGDGRVRSVVLKPSSSDLSYAWICAVWTPVFTEFMHTFLASERQREPLGKLVYREIDAQGDLPMGAVIKAAVESGLRVQGLSFPFDSYLDLGTPDTLAEVVRTSLT